MAVEQMAAFVGMTVAGEDEIDAVVFEMGQEVLAHLDEFGFGVGVVAALGVGRVVPEGDEPGLGGAGEVVGQPLGHRAGAGAG